MAMIKVGIVGLGLMGGSLSLALKNHSQKLLLHWSGS